MKLFVKNGKPPKARENAADRATIGARFPELLVVFHFLRRVSLANDNVILCYDQL